MLDPLNDNLFHERDDVEETKRSAANLEEILDETYDELKAYLLCRIEGGQNQLQMVTDKRNAILQANRVAKTTLEVFDNILYKEPLDQRTYSS